MTTTNITVSGMTCSACERVITKRLTTISGIAEIKVNVPGGNVVVTAPQSVSKEEVQKVLEGTHYKVLRVE